MILCVSKINVNKAWIQAKIHAEPASQKSFANQWCRMPTWHGEWRHREISYGTQSVLDLHTRDVETYQYEPLTWNTVVADSSSHDFATTENDGELVKRRESAETRRGPWVFTFYF